MATRLTSGNVQVRQVGNVPMQQINQQQTNYMFAANAKAQEANTLARILDDMSNSIGEYATKKRFEEGLQFAAENPLTPEQLQLAKDGMPSAIPGVGKISSDVGYFGQALKKARSLELSSHFEVEGRNELTKLLADVQNGIVTSDQVGAKISTMTEGYAKSLATVDPEASIKFRATMATHGNTVLNSAYEAELKRAKAQRVAKFDMDFDNGVRLLEAAVSQQPEMIDQVADVFRTNINNQSLLLGDAGLQKEYSTKFETALRNAKIQALTKEFTSDKYMADPLITLKKIEGGDAGKLSPVLQQLKMMDGDAVAKVTANFMAAVNHRESLKKQQAADAKASDEKSWADLYPQYLRAVEVNDQKTAANLRGRITDIYRKGTGAIPDSLFGSMFEKKQGKGDGVLKLNIQQSIYENKITDFDQIKKYVGKGITAEDASSFYSLLNSTNKNEQKDSDRRLYRLAKLKQTSEGMFILDEQSAEYKKYKALEARRAQIESDAVNDGKPITKSRATEILEQEELSKAKTDEAKSARNQLTTVYEKKPWINGPITRQSMPTLKHKAGNDINKQRDLKRIEELLTQAGE